VRPGRPRLFPIARAAGGLALAFALAVPAARAAEPDLPPAPVERSVPPAPVERSVPLAPVERSVPLAPVERSAPGAPFERSTLALPGHPLEAWSIAAGGGERLVAVSVVGSPPDERRHLTVFAPAPGGGVAQEASVALPAEAVSFDLADLEPGGPPELALLSAERLAVRTLGAGAAVERTLAPALPLPPPTRGFVRQPFLARWDGGARASALLPALGGLLLLPLDGGPAHPLAFPLYAFYFAGDEGAGVRPGVLQSLVTWPELATGDDDGDGRPDVFALSRYDVAVYRSGPGGLPSAPSRRVTLRPFTDEEELRFLASSVSLFARDLDGDGLVDLVQHKTFGTLLRSHATTSVWRNPGNGADPNAPPDGRIEGSGGFGSIFLEDLDGDGRLEAVQLLVPSGAMQLVRAVLTDTVQARLRAFQFSGTGFAAEPGFADDLTLPIETREGRVAGILPTVTGDFDGDGLRDLAFGESLVSLAFRLGVRGARGPGFGPVVARQPLAPSDRAVVGDFDGDGLDDVAAWDTRQGAGLALLRNRGRLARPGELREEPPAPPPELRAPEAPAAPGAGEPGGAPAEPAVPR